METSHSRLRKSVLAASIGSIVAGNVLLADRAAAQEADQSAGPQEIVQVTGSRIVRRDFASNSPIVTVNAEDFETQTGLNVEGYLNQLPNYNPAAAPTVLNGAGSNQDVQITPVSSVGIASISLRGFGPNRSLVLVDGKRLVPINSLMVTDINAIPSALIERVETITGGASAVYGADAVGGVTNFILRDDFEGFEVDAQYGTTDAGDGTESRVSAIFGADLDEGRGNVTIGVERYDREVAYYRNHDPFTERYTDPYAPGYFGFLQGTSHYNCLFNCPPQAAVDAVFADRPAGTEVFNWNAGNFFRQYNFNDDGTLWVDNSAGGLSSYEPAPNWSFYPTQEFDTSVPGNTEVIEGLKWHFRDATVSSPQTRYSFFGSGNYEISDNVRLFARAQLAESETETTLFGTSVIFGWETTVPYDPNTDSPILTTVDPTDPAQVAAALAGDPLYANPNFIPTGSAGAGHPVPAELALLLNNRFDPTGDWMPGWNPDTSLPPRGTLNTNTVWQVETGLDFDLGLGDWTGELYFSHGQSETYNNAFGNLSLERYRALTRLPDYGRNAMLSGNSGGQAPGFGAADITCTSGFYDTYFAGDQPLSDDCFAAVNATLQTRAQNIQDIIELNFEGRLADLPAGEVRMAAGLQTRDNEASFVPDILQSTVSFTDQVIGVYPTGYMDASTSVDDVYVEFLVPLVADVPAFRRLELELGARSSDYKEINETEATYKALLNWEITDWARLRGGVNRATRAPNIGELFLNQQEIFQIGGNNFGDPCGLRSTAPYGAGGTGPDPDLQPGETQPELAPGQTPEGAASARLICEAKMGTTAANQFYNVANATGGGGSAFNWIQQQGNSGLKPETADTFTFGAVLDSPFERAWLRGATLTFDYYKIDIEDAILLNSIDFANYNCYGSVLVTDATEAAAQAATSECQLLPRNEATGGPLTTAVSYSNQATIETAGADIALNWILPFGDIGMSAPGGIGFNLQATWLDYYRTKQSPASFDVETDWAGSLGPNLVGTNGGAYDYRLFGSFNYFNDNMSITLRWRHLPEVITAAQASQNAIIENNARVAAGGPGITLGYVPLTELKTDSYNIFDLAFNYNFTDSVTLRAGITNLFDEDPVEVGSERGYPIGTDLSSICGGAPGCQNPGAFALPETGGYNGGYYDVLGRRYFVGIDYRF